MNYPQVAGRDDLALHSQVRMSKGSSKGQKRSMKELKDGQIPVSPSVLSPSKAQYLSVLFPSHAFNLESAFRTVPLL